MNGRTRLAPMSRQHLACWALAAVVACLALVGCGGGGTASSSPNASSSGTQSAGLSAFQTCLKQHGVKITPRARGSFSPGASFSPRAFPSGSGFPTAFPSGGFGGGFGSGSAANSAAFKACQKYAPAGFRAGGGTISASAIAAFKGCMKQNGVTVTSTTFASLAKLSRSSKKAAAAYATCRVLLAQGFSRPSPTPTT
ncbi:MAG: hypothetical protein ACRDPY_30605 [Streptosporangiaceae bacterium]